jgi:hypothetical protein
MKLLLTLALIATAATGYAQPLRNPSAKPSKLRLVPAIYQTVVIEGKIYSMTKTNNVYSFGESTPSNKNGNFIVKPMLIRQVKQK